MSFSPRLQPSRTQWFLLLICAALTIALVYEIAAPLGAFEVPNAEPQRSLAAPAPSGPVVIPPVEMFSQINSRMVFDPERKRITPAPTIGRKDATDSSLVNVALIGVIIDKQRRLALLKLPDSPLATGVTEGASIGNWQVRAIEPDRIELRAGSKNYVIMLEANRAIAARPADISQKPPE